MVHLLRELERAGELTLAGVAHFNHQLRESADADEDFCRGIAAHLGVPFDAGRGDVRERARLEGRSVEDAARASRYEFLEGAADRAGAEAIAVAHSLDDQAETFLLRLLRGAGPRGLAGILPRAGRVVRPLLDVRRAELREYLAARQLAFREDETNADVAIPRNRVRHELIPYLEAWFSPGITDVLAREAAIAREDEDLLQIQAIDLASLIVLRKEADQNTSPATTRIDAARLTTLHPAMAARVARIALEQASNRYIGFDQIARLLAFARDARPGAALSLPGVRAMRDARGIVLGAARSRPPSPPESNSFRFPLSIPGEVRLDTQGWVISAGSTEAACVSGPAHAGPQGAPQPSPDQGGSVPVRSGSLKLPLAVRFRRPGDRLRPGGMGGKRKKLQDLFVDRKIPREFRDSVPLVVDDDDRIVWVVGEGVAEDFRVTAPSQGVIFLKARRLGGLG
jgi:tRNA(Ile)-lysidine synthase